MSQTLIRAALESALGAMAPALDTAWENKGFTPPANSVPYQKAYVLFAEPDDAEMGHARHTERGIFQITLCYQLGVGDSIARARADLIQTTFYRSASFVAGGVTVTVERTPEASGGRAEGDRWVVPVKIRFFSHI
jgi:hypothetical protein